MNRDRIPGRLAQHRRGQTDLFAGTNAMLAGAGAAVCSECGRALTDPKSVQAGIGPVCRGKGCATNGGEKNMHRARYTCTEQAVCIALEDRDQGKSITNDAEAVIRDLSERGLPIGVKPVIYRDTSGQWDMLRVKNGAFAGFVPLGGAQSFPEAVLALKARQHDYTSAEAAQRALEAVEKARRDPTTAAHSARQRKG